jgi:hypothetical protein
MGIAYGGAKRIGESGKVVLSNSIDGGMVENVVFSTYYKNPVVFTFMTTNNDIRAAQARVRNVTRNSCDIFFQRDDGLSHSSSEEICYLVMETGIHQLDAGGYVEVGSIDTDAAYLAPGTVDTAETINLTHSFTSTPAVIHSLNTNNNGAFMSSLIKSASTNSFLIQQNSLETGNAPQVEKIAWMAITPGTFNYYESQILSNSFTQAPRRINFTNSYNSIPDIIVKGVTLDGLDGYFMRGNGNLSTGFIDVFTEEDQQNDSETTHTTEAPVYIAVRSNSIFYEKHQLNGILNS